MLSEFLYFTALTTPIMPPSPWNSMAGNFNNIVRGFPRATSRK
jgi:hypothetical protein